MDNKKVLFEDMPVPKAVATLAIPTVLSMLVNLIYNTADTFFVGQTGDVNQVAAVSLTTPVFLLMMALGNMYGIGGSSVISRFLGAGDRKKIKYASSFCFYGSILTGFLMTAAFLVFMPQILSLIGVSQATVGFSRDYLTYVAFGAPFVVLSTALSHIVRSEGSAKAAMFGMMLGTITNIILDPIMILTMNMGVAGAAIATVIGNIFSCIFYIAYFLSGRSVLSVSIKDFRLKGIFVPVMVIGVPTTLNNILMSCSNILYNNFLASYGDNAVAAMGVAAKINLVVIMLQMGISMGVQPLIGYCYGANLQKRLKNATNFSILCTLAIGTLMTIVCFIFAKPIIQFFLNDSNIMDIGILMVHALMLSAPVLGILFIYASALQAMGKAVASLVLSLSRQGLVFIPLLFILDPMFGLQGIIYAQPVADIISIVMGAVMFFSIVGKMKPSERSTDEI